MVKPGKNLLVIDDDGLVRQSVVTYLKDSGFGVHGEAAGKAGLDWFENNRPDLVLTDLRMPDIDGLTILKAVKNIDRDVPVIVISGIGMVSDVAEALRLGAADYLTKPITDMEVLVHSINRSLNLYQLQKENNQYRAELEKANRDLKEYVRVLERDQKAGRQVQTNLLPVTPVSLAQITLSHKIIPSLYLSGDFVDYGMMSDRYIAFYLTDVSGHGAASAFVTVWLKQRVRRMFREQRTESDEGPGVDISELIRVVNREVINSKFGCHLTCFVGILDTHTHKLRYVLGGHLPLPVIIADGQAQYLTGKGKPVGIFEDATWDVYEYELPKTFSLMVFSDGVLEVLPPKDLIHKEQQLLELLAQTNGNIEDVCAKLKKVEPASAPDDIAILSLQSEASP